ncbi:hypothetical protein Aab01nite_82670 [Paractinoplanes abujensis]|nr:hypothetical protein Aab01nite_82670 [Actinoplanes abujensis]
MIENEFERAGEDISSEWARKFAMEEGVNVPSRYDIIVLCNFLTNTSMPTNFEAELKDLAQSLTPGGLLIVLGATRGSYPRIYGRLHEIVASTRLRLVDGLDDPIQAHEDTWTQNIVGAHLRASVAFASAAEPEQFAHVAGKLKKYAPGVVDPFVKLRFPEFRALVWKNEWESRRRG